ncbi:FAD-binding oxidoreductase [Dactylosporangium sp. NBC_01737]|uniref:FAD-dependent oxidoreductase n=1 Tax=Dactylosporangium sp. NBC_01737 TaxID=2975959 RepID=UPI002E1096B7|nr:FAD-binding oxidoreductase [Dactylosporangium sp. NBC_01737]
MTSLEGMDPPRPDVVVVGAGVIGLTTGIRLAERGLRVRVYADRRGAGTSSFAAGAIFDPLMADHPHRDRWAAATRRELELLHAQGLPWVRLLGGVEASRVPLRPPAPAKRLPGYRECTAAELPVGFVTGWHYRAPLVEMPPYLRWLEHRLETLHGEVRTRHLTTLAEAFADAGVVVNCSGVGARKLTLDGDLQPICGQLVVIANPGIHEFFVEHDPGRDLADSTYLLPQGELLLLGGSAEKTAPDLDPAPDAAIAEGIVRRCTAAFPGLAGAEVLGHRAGIRPKRTTVRLEHERLGEHHIVHNYGHGGSGVSLSWGCADEVTGVVRDLLGSG